jgi:hypothetical protein
LTGGLIALAAGGLPPSSHFIYIPVVLVLGIVLGFVLGSKATRDAFALEARNTAEREARRAARAAARAGAPAEKPPLETAGAAKPPDAADAKGPGKPGP